MLLNTLPYEGVQAGRKIECPLFSDVRLNKQLYEEIMTIKYEYNKDLNLLSVKVIDIITSGDILGYFNDLLDECAFSPGIIEVVDLNDVSDFILKFSDLEKIKLASEIFVSKGHRATLIYANSVLSKNIANIMMPLFQSVKFPVHLCTTDVEIEKYKNLLLQKIN